MKKENGKFDTSDTVDVGHRGGRGLLRRSHNKRVSAMSLTIGVFAFFILFLVYIGTFDIKIDSITANIAQFFEIIGPLGLTALASSVPFVASFIAGIFVGYRRY